MRNPVRRLKEVLGELLLNGQQGNALARHQAERLDGLEGSVRALAAELARVHGAVESARDGLSRVIHDEVGRLAGANAAPGSTLIASALLASPEVAARLLRLAALLVPQRARATDKCRIGLGHDGGYVMLDDWAGLAGALSIGIGNDDGWDREMVRRGLSVAQYDHTITAPPSTGPGLNWQPVGIAPADVNNLRSLRSLIALSGLPAEGDLLLKLDVEAAEWPALAGGEDAAPLGRFRQVLVEFHWFERIGEDHWFVIAEQALAHLNRSHAVVHVHGNNWGGMALIGGIPFPRVLEVTYARRDAYAFEAEAGLFPSALDAPCNPAQPDLFLGGFRFPPPPG